MFDLIFDFIGEVLAFCYGLWPSYGMAIVGLTLFVMIIVTPLTLKSTKSMLRMQQFAPEIRAIQKRHRGDRQKLNEEMLKFQQENGVSMFGGCLPLFVQMPLILVLYQVVRGLTSRVTDFGNQIGWTSGRIASGGVLDSTTFGSTNRPFLPQNLPQDSDLYLKLAGDATSTIEDRPHEMISWGIDLARSANDVFGESVISGIPYLLLILIVLVSSIFQQRQIQSRSLSAMPPQQQIIMKIIPYFLPIISFTLPAALVVYFVVSNLYRIGQQAYITRSLYRREDSPGAILARQREQTKKDESDQASSKKAITPKKGAPTRKRDGTFANQKNRKSGSRKNAPSRTNKKVVANQGGKRDSAKPARRGKSVANSSAAKLNGQKARKPKSSVKKPHRTGAGRTGNAPTRHHQSSRRTTKPGTPQNKKQKK